MSALKIAQALENCKVGPSIQRGVSSWLETLIQAQQRTPLLLVGAGQHEAPHLAKELHSATQQLFGIEGEWVRLEATELYKNFQTYGEQPLQEWSESTLFISGIALLAPAMQHQLLRTLKNSDLLRQRSNLLLLSWEEVPESPKLQTELKELFPHQLNIPPLYQRNADIDRQICRLAQKLIKIHDLSNVEGFSLESIAHIHRAILQTKQSGNELYRFLSHVLRQTKEERLPLHSGYIVAWPTVRQLEDFWGYRINKKDELLQEFADCDFQERLFSASIEHASCRSGFSKEVIEQQCQLLQRMLDELPPHQRNYQGLTSRIDHLQWLGMKLLSHARTQAELRDFFGFGGKGKIPKATAKLKFDQYELEHFGYRSTDPLPWQAKEQANSNVVHPNFRPTKAPSTPPPPVLQQTDQPATLCNTPTFTPCTEPRKIIQVSGELEETLFWRHQDLFTVLAADALTDKQIAQLMKVPLKRAKADLHELIKHGFLVHEENRYAIAGNDVYYRHTHSRLRCLEENLMRYLNAAFEMKETSILDNWFLRLPEEGLPKLRKLLLHPFIHEQFLPLSDHNAPPDAEMYDKKMYALMLLGTHRLSPQVHGRLPLEERVLYYFREASLQRADRQQQEQAICLRATQMLAPTHHKQAMQQVQVLRKQLRTYLPHGRGNKPNFNLTLCLTEVPLAFHRDLNPIQNEFKPFSF